MQLFSSVDAQIAWIDTPNIAGQFHRYLECSGKGVCDRTVGECRCFDSFEGKACQRLACPNGCSGHGTCEYMAELGNEQLSRTEGQVSAAVRDLAEQSDPAGFSNMDFSKLWESQKLMACVCDPGFADIDCARRMCPRSNDVMDDRFGYYDQFRKNQIQNVTLYGAGPFGNGTGSLISDFYNKTFALTFKSTLNETFTTIPLKVAAKETAEATAQNLARAASRALKALPNAVVGSARVSAAFGYERAGARAGRVAFLKLALELTGTYTKGPQHLVTVEHAACGAGCTPQLTGLSLLSAPRNGTMSFVREGAPSSFGNFECGRRGKCDYSTALCGCFSGYTGEACESQTALL